MALCMPALTSSIIRKCLPGASESEMMPTTAESGRACAGGPSDAPQRLSMAGGGAGVGLSLALGPSQGADSDPRLLGESGRMPPTTVESGRACAVGPSDAMSMAGAGAGQPLGPHDVDSGQRLPSAAPIGGPGVEPGGGGLTAPAGGSDTPNTSSARDRNVACTGGRMRGECTWSRKAQRHKPNNSACR